MTARSQLEARIATALAHLSEADMQRVAEDYARVCYPDRFPRFDFRAFSPEGKSRAGWPDAWIDTNGQLDGVEATCAKTKSAIEKHLEDYLNKARQCEPKLAGFLHVSGHPAVQMRHDEITTWRKRFVYEGGIDPDRLDLVFGATLIEALARPEFARTRIELLGLSELPKHFKLVGTKRGPDEGRLNRAFVPSDEDYSAGRVYRPVIADQVIHRLLTDGCVLIRGVGASGKSVLAWLLALEFAANRKPAYILDLADYADALPGAGNALVEDLHRFSHPQVLFILDNCHLNEALAKEVVLAWQGLVPSQQARLLVLGRELRTSRGSLIDGLGIDLLPLKARQLELLGVYRRLAWQRCGNALPPEPPPDVLNDWVAEFGGDPHSPDTTTDLIAFSAAAIRRMDELLKGSWSLSADDAIEEVRIVYLHPSKLSEQEFRNLIRLCAMEELELSLPQQALADARAGLERCNRQHGLVFHQVAGKLGVHVRYRLAHAALGRLILKATHAPVDRTAERMAVALQAPVMAALMIARLRVTGRLQEARALASEMMCHPECLLELPSLFYVHLALRQLQTVDSLPGTFGDTLIGQTRRRRILDMALLTPLGDLASFLGHAAKTDELRPVFEALATDLALPDNLKQLSEQALLTPLGDLASFLGYAAKSDELRPVFEALATDLALPGNLKRLSEQALLTPLGGLASFLGYAAKRDELRPVFEALATDLALPDNLKRLSEQALLTPLHILSSFLGYAAKSDELRPIFEALATDLALPDNLKQLSEQALLTRLNVLANFLGYAAKTRKLKPVFARLATDLALPDNLKRLSEQALLTPLEGLANFLGYAAETTDLKPLFAALATDLALPDNLERLSKRALLTPLDGLANFLGYVAETDKLKPLLATVSQELGLPGNIERLGKRASLAPLDHLAAFLSRTAKITELKPVFAAVTKELARPKNCKHLAKSMCSQPLHAVVSALTSQVASDLWNAVFAEIDHTIWEEARRLEQSPELRGYVTFQGIAVQRGRGELAYAPAQRIVSASTREDWQQPGIGLHHLSHVLRMARAAPTGDLELFLDRVVTGEWVDGLINTAPTSGLAASLFSFAMVLDADHRKCLLRNSVQNRVARELSWLRVYDTEARAQVLSLLGGAAAMGVNIALEHVDWLDNDEVAEIVELRAPGSGVNTIGHVQAQLWLGLREMAKARTDPVQVPPLLSNRILDLWIATQEGEAGKQLRPAAREINAVMIAWLQRCKAAQWKLARG